MTILIVPCNHWIGYHITSAFLNENVSLDGMIDSSMDDHLTMFFGRNNQFQLIEQLKKSYEACIIVGEFDQINKVRADKKLIIQTEKTLSKEYENTTIIRPPLLFGEWMPMNDKGLYQKERFISFDSEEFRKNALSIDRFTSFVLQWYKSSQTPLLLEMNPADDTVSESSIFIREDGSLEKQLETLKQHYRRYRNFYQ